MLSFKYVWNTISSLSTSKTGTALWFILLSFFQRIVGDTDGAF